MTEAIEKTNIEEAAVVEPEKPYNFRKLGAPDIFLMSKIIGKIGINELKTCFDTEGMKDMVLSMFAKEKEESGDNEASIIKVGVSVSLDIATTIFSNLPKCESEIYQLLAQTSNLTVDEIKAPGNGVMFFEMLIDFIKKEEFKDFFRVVSRLFN